MIKSELDNIVAEHGKWLRNEGRSCAYLRGANLRGADLRGAYLSGAYLSGADLRDAYLSGAYLSGANLRGANLRGADLRGANLRGADLSGAYGGNARMQCLQIDPYRIIVLDKEIVWGGCTKKTVQEWLDYDDDRLNESDKKYLETITKPFIKMCIGAE